MITFTILMSSLWVASLSQESMPNIQLSLALKLFQGGGRYNSLTAPATVNPCQPNPCLYGGSCIPADDQKDYQCTNCPYPMGGKNCSELSCSPDCLRVDDTVYFIYATEGRSFHESKLKCQERNMTLAMIKDTSVHLRIRKQLRLLHANDLDEYYCYWIGLTQADNLSPWKWIDGTELGPYDDWGSTEIYRDHYCGQICRYKVYKFLKDVCEGSDGWNYSSFCEKSYSFLKG